MRMSCREHDVVPSFAMAYPADVGLLERHQIVRIGRHEHNVTIVWDWNRRSGTMLCVKIDGPESLHLSTVGCADCMGGPEEDYIEDDGEEWTNP